MVKGQFSTLDLAAAIGELQVLQGMRVANIYDVDSKTYLLKVC
jgi:predicted ribosome quality control (RQC) complex YloA/Tae2 family protein